VIKKYLVKSSTLALFKAARRQPHFRIFDWLHGYVYGRWTYLYIGIGSGEHPAAKVLRPLVNLVGRFLPSPPVDGRGFADSYHGKVVPLDSAAKLVTIQEDIDLGDLEQVIPYSRARDIVLKNPDHIVVLECPCRSVRAKPCLPLDVCLIVGEPFASFVQEHHPSRSRWISQDEAVEILQAEHERGHVSHAFFKDAMLDRFYAICNCCSCCCGAMQAHQHGTPMLASSGYVAQIDDELCKGCGLCAEACPFDAISLEHGRAIVSFEACMGCGVCVARCQREALTLHRDPAKGVPLEIEELMEAAAACA
jgi:ferredoxin